MPLSPDSTARNMKNSCCTIVSGGIVFRSLPFGYYMLAALSWSAEEINCEVYRPPVINEVKVGRYLFKIA